MQPLLLRTLKAQLVLLITSMIFFTTGCEDDDHDHDEEHTDADGFVLEDESGSQVYREFEGDTTGSIILSIGDTLELSVHFLDHDGNEIEHGDDEHDTEESEIRITGNDESVAIIEAEEHEQGEEEHGEAIHVIGVSKGSTSFKLELMHEGHADYVSTNNVPVIVN